MPERKFTDERKYSPKIKTLVGQKFGKLYVKEFWGTENARSLWLCVCECGKEKVLSSKNLLTNKVQSCGCLKNKGYEHGDSIKNGHKERLYKVYKGMVNRCYYPNVPQYKNYGARGISVCDEWLNSYEAFKKWALENGYDENAPKYQCTLDRIDGNKNYCPENCRWVSMKEQLNNTSQNVWITANGLTLNIQQWADKLGVLHSTLQTRKRMGWSDEKIVNTPIRKYEMRNRRSGR
jgi:hypothetical protein